MAFRVPLQTVTPRTSVDQIAVPLRVPGHPALAAHTHHVGLSANPEEEGMLPTALDVTANELPGCKTTPRMAHEGFPVED